MIKYKFLNTKIRQITAVALIELIMSIVIINIGFIALVMVFQISIKIPTKKNIKTATIIANNYLNEIIGKNFASSLPCINSVTNISRMDYTELCHYHNLIDLGAKDYLGNQIPGLEKFNVYTKIAPANNLIVVNPAVSNNMLTSDLAKIEVTVTHPKQPNIVISSYKGNY